MPVNAFAATSCTLVSNAMGAGRPQEVMPIARRIIRICYMIIIPLMFFVFVQPTLLLHIYTDNEALIKESIPSL